MCHGQAALFLLDRPDTHLNPHWRYNYLDLIRDWTGVAADAQSCHIVMTSHNPLTIAALTKDAVRVMFSDESGKVGVSPPYADPRAWASTATLTEIFGLSTSLDLRNQRLVDDRNALARIDERTAEQQRQLLQVSENLTGSDSLFEDKEPLYQGSCGRHDVRYGAASHVAATAGSSSESDAEIISGLLAKEEGGMICTFAETPPCS